jgi:hypothetical protein
MKTKLLTLAIPGICHMPPSHYYVFNGTNWRRQDRTMVQILLASRGVSYKATGKQLISDMEQHLLDLSLQQDVSYAGGVGGFNAGVYEMAGNRVLVTDSPSWINPAPGPHPILSQLFSELMGPIQLPYFYSWLHVAMRMFTEQRFRPGHVLVMVGAPDSGKSLLQDLITAMFGNRVAEPFQYMVGDTTFNSELTKASHLLISDEGPKNGSARDRVGQILKKYATEHTQRCSPKGMESFAVACLQRVTMTLNDDHHSMQATRIS